MDSYEDEEKFNFGDQTSEAEKRLILKSYRNSCELLLSAGYFRVRVRSLSPFDKVVGGLCWCISASGQRVDVDLLYRENMTIGVGLKFISRYRGSG